MQDTDLLSIFAKVGPDAGPTMLARFRDAERRTGVVLGVAYAERMVHNALIDRARAADAAPRVAARQKARREAAAAEAQAAAEARALRARGALELAALAQSETVATWSPKQVEAVHLLWAVAVEGESPETVGARHGLSTCAVWQRVCRARKQLRPVALAFGATALLATALRPSRRAV